MGDTVVNEEALDTIGDDSGATGETPNVADTSSQQPTAQPPRALRLAKLMAVHVLVFLLALSLFAAADSWSALTGLAIARLLAIATGALAGLVIATLVHEWFHYLGARFSGARYSIPKQLGLFLYDWDFDSNDQRQFLLMSIAGTIGGAVSVVLLWNSVPADTWGRAALQGGAIASVVFAAGIEWPIINRVRKGADPQAELSTINQQILTRSFATAAMAGVLISWVLAP